MALLINQGKQKKQTGNFDPVEQKNAQLTVEKIELDKYNADSLRVTFRILNGENKNRNVFDSVCYNPTSKFLWKYQALREACGHPYDESEPAQLDIEALLLNTVLYADLSVRKYNDKNGDEKEAQNFKYKAAKKAATTPAVTPTVEKAATFDATDDDLPFDSAVDAEQPQLAKETPAVEAAKPVAKPSVNSSYEDWD